MLVFGVAGSSPLPIAASRIRAGGDAGIIVFGGPPLPPGWHGGQVLSRVDGALLGVLLTTGREGGARIAPIPPATGGR